MRLAKLLLLIAVLSFVLSIFCSAENPDIYYYMGCVQLLLEGKVPFVDFHTHYTPMSFYMACLPAYFFGTGNTAALSFVTFLNFVNAGLVYCLLRREVKDKTLCLFAVVLYLMSLFVMNGVCYMLEPFIMFWGLLSLIAVQRESLWSVLAAGAFSFFAFWTKQYGLGFFVLNILYLLLARREGDKASPSRAGLAVSFFIGFAVAGCCMVGALLMQGATLSGMVGFSGQAYERFGFLSLLQGYGYLLRVVLFLPVGIYLFIKHFKSLRDDKLLIVCLCGILGFMLTTYVRPYPHYLQLSLPFAVLLIAIMVDRYGIQLGNERLVKWFKASIIVPLVLVMIGDYNFIFYNERQAVDDVAAEVAKIIPEGTDKVYVSTKLLCVAHVNRYGAPMLWKHGMSNGFVEEGEPLREVIMDAGSYVIDTVKLEYLRREEPELMRHIEEGRHATRIDCRDKRFVSIVYN
ncbi:MAG: hypothetical protein IKQ37_11070 [Bacteroidaceae bacterium]|nr:hypothetical protein [Bacteroidaceae bacterium]